MLILNRLLSNAGTLQRRSSPHMILYTVFIVLCLQPAHAEVYKWVKPDGTVVYSDQPEDADTPVTRIESPSVPVLDMAPVPRQRSSRWRSQDSAAKSAESGSSSFYQTLTITSPANDMAVRDNAGQLNVTVQVLPSLIANHQVQLLNSGQVVSAPQKGLSFNIELFRGTHSLTAQIVDDQGQIVMTGPATVVHMQRYSALQKRNSAARANARVR